MTLMRIRYLAVDLRGNQRLGPAWLSARLEVDAPDAWTSDQLSAQAAEYYGIPVDQVREITAAEYGREPWEGDVVPPEGLQTVRREVRPLRADQGALL